MKDTKIPVIILAIIAAIAIIGLILIVKAQNQGAVTYHQVLHRDYAVLVDYNPCEKAPCGIAAVHIGDAFIGDAVQSANAICQCPDGRTYQISHRRNY